MDAACGDIGCARHPAAAGGERVHSTTNGTGAVKQWSPIEKAYLPAPCNAVADTLKSRANLARGISHQRRSNSASVARSSFAASSQCHLRDQGHHRPASRWLPPSARRRPGSPVRDQWQTAMSVIMAYETAPRCSSQPRRATAVDYPWTASALRSQPAILLSDRMIGATAS